MRFKTLVCLSLAALFVLVACGSREMGSISGHVFYERPTKEKTREPMKNVKIILCEVNKDKGLPEGPVVAYINRNKVERIGILKAEPTAITNSDGSFILSNVPVGTYLILFHLWPDKLRSIGDEWEGIGLTEACLDQLGEEILASGKSDFWEEGGIIGGLSDWSSQKGFTVTKGNICSESLGFCLSVRDRRPYPIVEVQPDSTVEIVITTHFKPKGEK